MPGSACSPAHVSSLPSGSKTKRQKKVSADRDFEAITTIWLGAVENYWIATSLHNDRPLGIDEDRFVRQCVHTLMTAIGATK